MRTVSGVVVVLGLLASCVASNSDVGGVETTVAATPVTEIVTTEPDVPTTAASSTTTTTLETTTSTQATTTTSSEPGICEQDGTSMMVDASCFERAWSLTADQGVLMCDADAVTIVVGDQVYALNGLARQRELGAELEPIWKDNPDVAGTKVSIGSLIDMGLTLCQ